MYTQKYTYYIHLHKWCVQIHISISEHYNSIHPPRIFPDASTIGAGGSMGVSWQCCWLVGIKSNKQNILKHYLLVKLWMVLLLSFWNDKLKLRVLFSEHIIQEFPSKKSNCSELRCIVAMDKNLEHKKNNNIQNIGFSTHDIDQSLGDQQRIQHL